LLHSTKEYLKVVKDLIKKQNYADFYRRIKYFLLNFILLFTTQKLLKQKGL